MMALLAFIGITVLLIAEGWAIAGLLLPNDRSMKFLLSLPLAAFSNVILVLLFTIISISLNFASLLAGHMAIITIVMFASRWIKSQKSDVIENHDHAKRWRDHPILVASCSIILTCIATYSFSHAILLPSFQYDSATNWTMRSQISFYDQHIAFDPTEVRGMAKPQYPFLFHSLQITANAGNAKWSDRSANGILYLLSLFSIGSLALLLVRSKGKVQALVGVTLLCSIPLFAVHLAQGYGDLNLAQYFLLSLLCLSVWIEDERQSWLLLSSIFVAASVWTKTEGLFYGLLPWTIVLCYIAWRSRTQWKNVGQTIGMAWLLSAPWIIFAKWKGLGLTPHGSDTTFGWHPEGLAEVWPALFSRGSFGILWYVLPVAIAILLFATWKKKPFVQSALLPTLIWGGLMFAEVLFTYLFTPNVQFLLNAEAFYRQMMVPGALLLLSCIVCFREK